MMLKRFIPMVLVLALSLTLPVNATYNIIWVSEDIDNDGDGTMDDQGWIDHLTAQGYSVDVQRNYWQTLEEDLDDSPGWKRRALCNDHLPYPLRGSRGGL